MIKPQSFNSQVKLLKWLKRGGVKWTKTHLAECLYTIGTSFQTTAYRTHVYVIRLRLREYFVSNYGGDE